MEEFRPAVDPILPLHNASLTPSTSESLRENRTSIDIEFRAQGSNARTREIDTQISLGEFPYKKTTDIKSPRITQ